MEKITGYIDHIIYANAENGYTVLLLITDDEQKLVCVGTFLGIDNGICIELEGDYVDHPTYGTQFKAQRYHEIMPEAEISIERYLASGAIKGIGEALAKRIVKRFGKDTFYIMENEPERLAEIKGISNRIAQEIGTQVYEKRQMREAFIFLQQYGISNNLAVKIYEFYKDRVYSVLRENPYLLAEDISGVGFKIADDIANKMGINADSEYRIRCGILYALSCASTDGNTYLPMDILLRKTAELIEVEEKEIFPHVQNLAIDKKVIIKKDHVYATTYYYSELACARMLCDLDIVMDEELFKKQEDKINAVINTVVKEQEIELDTLQKEAVIEAIKHGVTVISGGPGTGKTTTINTIIRYFDAEGMDIFLAAPTGRAAKRMQEATGYEAKTIHRLLEVNGGMVSDSRAPMFERNEENPLEADVIIVDEMSMIDIHLFKALLSAISIGTRLIMVGDVDQLPSVGPGQVLRDIIDSNAFSTVILKRIFRQSEESDIVVNAHKINNGQRISLDNKSKDFFFLERSDYQVIYKHMIQLIKDKLPSYVGATMFDIQVLTPMKKGALGVETLNNVLQEYLNPKDDSKEEYERGEHLFREGDKVMQVKNNYQLTWQILSKYNIPIDEGTGVFNGDTGIVKHIDRYGQIMEVEFDEGRVVEYPFSGLDELELAYAVTVHKSQGSEYPAVILPILSGPKMLLNRNLFYTAVTRAKKCVTILGSANTIFQMIENDNIYERYSSLKDRICEVISVEDF